MGPTNRAGACATGTFATDVCTAGAFATAVCTAGACTAGVCTDGWSGDVTNPVPGDFTDTGTAASKPGVTGVRDDAAACELAGGDAVDPAEA